MSVKCIEAGLASAVGPASALTGKAAASGFAFVNSFAALGGFVGPMAFGLIATDTGDYARGL